MMMTVGDIVIELCRLVFILAGAMKLAGIRSFFPFSFEVDEDRMRRDERRRCAQRIVRDCGHNSVSHTAIRAVHEFIALSGVL